MVIVLLTTLLGSGTASPMQVSAGPQPPNGPYPPPNTEPAGNLDYRLLAKAKPDECFDAAGNFYRPSDLETAHPCISQPERKNRQPHAESSYIGADQRLHRASFTTFERCGKLSMR